MIDGSFEIEPDLGPEPWLRLAPGKGKQGKNESAKAYAAFEHYFRSSPAQRSHRHSADALGKHRTQLHRWSDDFHWMKRTEAWDRRQSEVAAAALERAQREEAEYWAEQEKKHRIKKYQVAEELSDIAMRMVRQPFYEKQIQRTDDAGNQTVKLKPNCRIHDTGTRMIKTALALGDESIRKVCPAAQSTLPPDVYETVDYEPKEDK